MLNVILPHRGCLEMSGDILDGHTWTGKCSSWNLEGERGQVTANHLQCTGQSLMTNNNLASNVNNTEVETPY